MLADGTPKEDVKLPEGEIGEQMKEAFLEGKDLIVTVLSAMGEEQVFATILIISNTEILI